MSLDLQVVEQEIPSALRTKIGQYIPRDVSVRGGWGTRPKSPCDKAWSFFHSNFPDKSHTDYNATIAPMAAAAYSLNPYPLHKCLGYAGLHFLNQTNHAAADRDHPLPVLAAGAVEVSFERMQRLYNVHAHQMSNLKFAGMLAAGLAISYAHMEPLAVPEFISNMNLTRALELDIEGRDHPTYFGYGMD